MGKVEQLSLRHSRPTHRTFSLLLQVLLHLSRVLAPSLINGLFLLPSNTLIHSLM
jgi:hypothetical protein